MKHRIVIRMHSATAGCSFEVQREFEAVKDTDGKDAMERAEAIRADLDSRFPGFASVIAEVQRIVFQN